MLWIPALADAGAVSMANEIVIHVDDDAAPGGDGTGSLPYDTLPEAVAAAHAAPGAVVIKVEPGDYALSEPLVIERSMDLRGSTEQVVSDDPWPSGEPAAGTETRVFSTNTSMAQLVRVGRADGGILSDVSIRGFVFEGTVIGVEVLLTRVQDYRVMDNIFALHPRSSIDSVWQVGRTTSAAGANGRALQWRICRITVDDRLRRNRSVRNGRRCSLNGPASTSQSSAMN
jgi:hypothetical protein